MQISNLFVIVPCLVIIILNIRKQNPRYRFLLIAVFITSMYDKERFDTAMGYNSASKPRKSPASYRIWN